MFRVMKIAVLGTGHVGLVTAASLSHFGHEVVGFDDDPAKVDALLAGQMPFFEPGLLELVGEGTGSAALRFTHDNAEAMEGARVVFICVGTPGRPDGEANLIAVERAARSVGELADDGMVVVEKSTVPVQTAERVKMVLERSSEHRFHIVSNPEFLREGRAVEDSLQPDRILVGADDPEGHAVMRQVYAPLIDRGVTYLATDLRTAELAKHACNAFLALKISYANALARIAEACDADVVMIADIMGSDPRIGRAFLDAGLGYGGYCLPKDVAAFSAQAARLGYQFPLLDEIQKINEESVRAVFEKVKEALWNLEDKRVAILGLSFKPGTDDVRESPALKLARMLLDAGARVVGHDPQANLAAKSEMPEIETAEDPYVAADGAHCLVVCTDWPEFRELDVSRLKAILGQAIVVDGRNVFDPKSMEEAGFTYLPTGRPAVNL